MIKTIVMTDEEIKAAEIVYSIFERICEINDNYSFHDLAEMVICRDGIIDVEVEEE